MRDDVVNEAFEMLVDDDLESFIALTIADGEVEMVWQAADGDSPFEPPHLQLLIGHAIVSLAEVTEHPPEAVARGAIDLAESEGVNIEFTGDAPRGDGR